ncbi:flagellar protein FlaG [Mariprofundus sp. EBB-1]|nr:flagellar protein FlaG [Mariprofundus sp. EBB-1]
MGSANVRPVSQPQASPTPPVQQNVQNKVEQKVSTQDLQKAIQQANVSSGSSGESIAFGYEEKLGQLFVTVTDKHSGEVIREIPSKDFIQHKIFMKEMVGLLLDKQV